MKSAWRQLMVIGVSVVFVLGMAACADNPPPEPPPPPPPPAS